MVGSRGSGTHHERSLSVLAATLALGKKEPGHPWKAPGLKVTFVDDAS